MTAIVALDSGKPLGDAVRTRHWLRTGSSGPVAAEALHYERERGRRYAEHTAPN